MSIEQLKATVLEQCLPLLATKPSDGAVELDSMSVPAHSVGTIDQLRAYHAEFTYRRLLAAVPQLIATADAVAALPSRTRQRDVREERALVGPLDIPRYSRRMLSGDLRRSFPIVVSRVVHDTPENRLTLGLVRSARRALQTHPFPKTSAEAVLSRTLSAKLERLTRYALFRDVDAIGVRARDISSTRFRVARRLTSNDATYKGILRWVDEWTELSPGRFADASLLVDVALPSSDSYWEKVFEVWCLQMVRETLAETAWLGPVDWTLNTRSAGGHVATVCRDGCEIEVYFQSQKPLGQGEWKQPVGKRLRGIPDLTLAAEGLSPLLVDAKWRYQTGNRSSSEEQYKMLGYAENFRDAFAPNGFHGVLVFPSDRRQVGRMSRGDAGRLTTLKTDLTLSDVRQEMAVAIEYWLDSGSARTADSPATSS